MKSLFAKSSAILALGLAAMVATTTSAHASSFGVVVGTQGELGGTGAGSNSGSATAAGGTLAGASTSYDFVYTNIGTTQPPGANGFDGAVSLDTATVTQSNQGSCTSGCGVIALDADFSGNTGAVTLTLTGLAAGAYDLTFSASETQQLFSNTPGNPIGSCGNVSPQCNTPFEAGVTASGAGGSSVAYVGPGGSAGAAAQSASVWTVENFDFTTGGGTEVITFTPTSLISTNVPAFALIDDVSLAGPPSSTVPEPNSLMLLSTGLLGLGGFVRMRIKNGAASKA